MYEVGQTLVWTVVTRDAAGTIVDPTAAPTAALTLPDATTASGTVTKTATGTYRVTAASPQVGRVRMRASSTDAGTVTTLPWSDVADVLPADPRLICSLADVRAAMNTPAAQRVSDDEVRGYIAAATLVVEDIVGPVLGASRTEVHDGGQRAILLFDYPTAAITSVTEDGVTLSASDYCLGDGGILYRGSRPGTGRWSHGARNVTITYPVGGTSIDPNVRLAAAELVAFWYGSTQIAGRPGLQSGAAVAGGTFMSMGYAVPHAVRDKLLPSVHRSPGFA